MMMEYLKIYRGFNSYANARKFLNQLAAEMVSRLYLEVF